MTDLPIMTPATPVMFLAVSGMVLLLLGAFAPADAAERMVTKLTLVAMAVTLGLVLFVGGGTATAFSGMFVTDGFAVFMKVLVLLGSASISRMKASGGSSIPC